MSIHILGMQTRDGISVYKNSLYEMKCHVPCLPCSCDIIYHTICP